MPDPERSAENKMTNKLTIEECPGTTIITDAEELVRRLQAASKEGKTEFWLAHKKWPTLTIALTDRTNLAYIHYFPEEDHPGFQPIPKNQNTDLIPLLLSSHEDTTMEARYFVDLETAYAAAAEFFETEKLPSSIEWQEL
ncbi:MAG: Immunity protein Imm1 [Rariglobus sp.]|jgi:hypothetical protein|nr:Immunity protein Imm1 [Rariglobus sp.]